MRPRIVYGLQFVLAIAMVAVCGLFFQLSARLGEMQSQITADAQSQKRIGQQLDELLARFPRDMPSHPIVARMKEPATIESERNFEPVEVVPEVASQPMVYPLIPGVVLDQGWQTKYCVKLVWGDSAGPPVEGDTHIDFSDVALGDHHRVHYSTGESLVRGESGRGSLGPLKGTYHFSLNEPLPPGPYVLRISVNTRHGRYDASIRLMLKEGDSFAKTIVCPRNNPRTAVNVSAPKYDRDFLGGREQLMAVLQYRGFMLDGIRWMIGDRPSRYYVGFHPETGQMQWIGTGESGKGQVYDAHDVVPDESPMFLQNGTYEISVFRTSDYHLKPPFRSETHRLKDRELNGGESVSWQLDVPEELLKQPTPEPLSSRPPSGPDTASPIRAE